MWHLVGPRVESFYRNLVKTRRGDSFQMMASDKLLGVISDNVKHIIKCAQTCFSGFLFVKCKLEDFQCQTNHIFTTYAACVLLSLLQKHGNSYAISHIFSDVQIPAELGFFYFFPPKIKLKKKIII